MRHPIFRVRQPTSGSREDHEMKSPKLKIAIGVVLAFVMALPIVG
jgi:hypothetical protein